jgi:CRISPR system Cascade subunit CasC
MLSLAFCVISTMSLNPRKESKMSQVEKRLEEVKKIYQDALKGMRLPHINFHLVRAYCGNPNRDDTGRAKTAVLGLTRRNSITSQAIKYAIRHDPGILEIEKGGQAISTQTRRVLSRIWKEASEKAQFKDPKARTTLLRNLLVLFGLLSGSPAKKILPSLKGEKFAALARQDEILAPIFPAKKSKNNEDTDTEEESETEEASDRPPKSIVDALEKLQVSRFADSEIKTVSDLAQTEFADMDDKKLVEKMESLLDEAEANLCLTTDQAMHGRMSPGHMLPIEAAASVAYAIGTTELERTEIDYGIAADEFGGQGAAHIYNRESADGIVYMHETVSLPTLIANRGYTLDEALEYLSQYLLIWSRAQPKGYVHSYAHLELQTWHGVSFSNRPVNYRQAFLIPVEKQFPDLTERVPPNILSVMALHRHIAEQHKIWIGSSPLSLREEFATYPNVTGAVKIGTEPQSLDDLQDWVRNFKV